MMSLFKQIDVYIDKELKLKDQTENSSLILAHNVSELVILLAT